MGEAVDEGLALMGELGVALAPGRILDDLLEGGDEEEGDAGIGFRGSHSPRIQGTPVRSGSGEATTGGEETEASTGDRDEIRGFSICSPSSLASLREKKKKKGRGKTGSEGGREVARGEGFRSVFWTAEEDLDRLGLHIQHHYHGMGRATSLVQLLRIDLISCDPLIICQEIETSSSAGFQVHHRNIESESNRICFLFRPNPI